MRARMFLLASACLCGLACNSPEARLNGPQHGDVDDKTPDMDGTLVYMNDNALLADMNMSDYHFMPHRAALTSLGEERLSRLAMLMKAYGGTLRFNTDLAADSTLRKERVDSLVEFLHEVGLDASAGSIAMDAPGGKGMDASASILIKANEGTYKPKKDSSGAGASKGNGVSSGTSGK